MKKSLFLLLCAIVIAQPVWASEQPDILTEKATDEAAVMEVVTLAGTGGHGITDGDEAARFNLPASITGDGTNLYIADTNNNLIRVYNADGVTSTLSGAVYTVDENRFPRGFHTDGKIGEALFNRPGGIVYGPSRRIYVADTGNHAIRAIDPDKVTTYSGGTIGYRDGHVNDALFNSPTGIAIDAANNLYITDTLNHVVRKIDDKGNVTTIAGTPGVSGYEDGTSGRALFNAPTGIAVTPDGNGIYVADTGNHRIRLIRGQSVTTYAGTAELIDQDGEPWGEFLNGENAEAKFNIPVGLALHGTDLLVADSGNNLIRVITDEGVSTLAGTGEPGADDGPALEAMFHLPRGLYVKDDTLYIADTGNNLIRCIQLGEAES